MIPESSLSDKLSPRAELDRAIQARIGDQLRAMYDDLMQQPVPDRFKDSWTARKERTRRTTR